MRPAAIAIALLCLLAAPTAADQTHPRLNLLFQELQATDDPLFARIVQGRIWALWFQHEDPEVEALMDEGRAAMAARRYEDALAAFDRIVELDPDYAEGWNRRATLYYLMGRYEDSLADIEKVLALEPRHFGALSGRGLVFTELERLDEAIAAFEAALEVNPHMESARRNAEFLREELHQREI